MSAVSCNQNAMRIKVAWYHLITNELACNILKQYCFKANAPYWFIFLISKSNFTKNVREITVFVSQFRVDKTTEGELNSCNFF